MYLHAKIVKGGRVAREALAPRLAAIGGKNRGGASMQATRTVPKRFARVERADSPVPDHAQGGCGLATPSGGYSALVTQTALVWNHGVASLRLDIEHSLTEASFDEGRSRGLTPRLQPKSESSGLPEFARCAGSGSRVLNARKAP